MTPPIDSFRGQYRFLSNFYPSPFPTLEHHFQASKATTVEDAIFVMSAAKSEKGVSTLLVPDPGEAKRRGRAIKCRDDWDDCKIEIMHGWLVIKFLDPMLRGWLRDTGDAELIEGNTWGDRFWGKCNGEGENVLGELLMIVRANGS